MAEQIAALILVLALVITNISLIDCTLSTPSGVHKNTLSNLADFVNILLFNSGII